MSKWYEGKGGIDCKTHEKLVAQTDHNAKDSTTRNKNSSVRNFSRHPRQPIHHLDIAKRGCYANNTKRTKESIV